MDETGAVGATWGLWPGLALVPAAALGLGMLVAVLDRAVTADVGASRALVETSRTTLRWVTQQRRTTVAPDRLLWRAGCAGVLVLAVLSLAVVPIGDRTFLSTSADLVWFNAMEALLWAAVWLVGWGPNSVHALVAGYRYLAQGLAYELPLMFALITAGLGAGSLNTAAVVAAQSDLWFVVTMPVAFVAFVAGAAAFAFWGPFGTPAGADVAGGVLVELSGVERLLVQAGRAVFLGGAAAMAAALFLGAGSGPLLPGPLWHLLKTVAVLVGIVVVGRRLPALRPDRVVEVAWVVAVPATVVQALVVAVLVLNGFYA
jgi:NADH-quinone oxidoreductase subunit H